MTPGAIRAHIHAMTCRGKDKWIVGHHSSGAESYVVHTHRPRFVVILHKPHAAVPVWDSIDVHWIDELSDPLWESPRLLREAGEAFIDHLNHGF